MLYIKIGNEKYPAKFQTFRTQANKEGIRVIGDCPTANGFLIVDDNDEVVFDRSEYTYLYREDDRCKEYTKEYEEIIPTESFAMGDVPTDPIYSQLSALSQRIDSITPYTESKTVGIQDAECVFTGVGKDGTITANVKTENGEYLPCTVERADSRVRVLFDKLDTVATVTIQIQ